MLEIVEAVLCLNSVRSQIELENTGALLKEKLHYAIVLGAKLKTLLQETLDFITRQEVAAQQNTVEESRILYSIA